MPRDTRKILKVKGVKEVWLYEKERAISDDDSPVYYLWNSQGEYIATFESIDAMKKYIKTGKF